MKRLVNQIVNLVTGNPLWKSLFRHGYPKTDFGRAQTMLTNFFLHIMPVKCYKNSLKITYTFGLGLISFILFVILTVTGILLMFYYVPSTDRAYWDIKDLQFVVHFGQLLRDMHRWGAHAMVLIVILHMMRVFYTGSYKKPREFNWIVGVILLLFTLLLSFTGYLLPWDQLAIWAVTVGTNMAAAHPFIGNEGPGHEFMPMPITDSNDIRFAIIGGTVIGQNGLLRAYVYHCVFMPVILLIGISIHFWRIRKDGGLSRPESVEKEPNNKVHVWPHLVFYELVVTLGVVAVIWLWAMLMHSPLEEMANPTLTPNPSTAPWYFIGLQELLVYFDPWIAGVVLPGVILVGLMAMPYLDTKPEVQGYYNISKRRFEFWTFTFGIFLWFAFIIIGYFMRGQNWQWYWPWQDRSVPPLSPMATVNMPGWLGWGSLIVFFGAGMAVPLLAFKNWVKERGLIRYSITMLLLLMMLGVVIKIILRVAFHIKYVIHTPWFNI